MINLRSLTMIIELGLRIAKEGYYHDRSLVILTYRAKYLLVSDK